MSLFATQSGFRTSFLFSSEKGEGEHEVSAKMGRKNEKKGECGLLYSGTRRKKKEKGHLRQNKRRS